jgi:hypothetical protein
LKETAIFALPGFGIPGQAQFTISSGGWRDVVFKRLTGFYQRGMNLDGVIGYEPDSRGISIASINHP